MRTSTLAAAAGILAIAATSFAAPAKAPAKVPAKAQVKVQKVWASGQIKSVDGTAQTVVVTQGSHEMSFVIAPNAHLMDGKKTLQTKDLAQDVGRSVKVRYEAVANTKTADLVELTATKPARQAKTSAKS